jgi:D-beta-D-heptose 7-phosphate kinase/D-beta-D-heptose 1-phosphate adenosyltransferase
MNHLPLERVEEILGRIRGRRLLVLGDAMLDRYLWGDSTRISPEAPVPIVEMREQTHRLGGAANVARNVAALGGAPVLVAVRGQDPEGELLEEEMRRLGLDPAGLVVDPGRPTTLKTRVMARNQQVVRADRESRAEVTGAVLDEILARLEALGAEAEGVIISDYGKGVITGPLLERMLPRWEEAGLPVCVDPKETHFFSYRGVTVITPNQTEAGFAYGKRIQNLRTLEEVGLGLLRRLEAQAVLITRGEQGMSLFSRGGRIQHFPTVGTEVYDVTGAGDTVVASFAAALVGGATLAEAAVISNHAAGRVIREVGTAAVTPEELLASFREMARGAEGRVGDGPAAD